MSPAEPGVRTVASVIVPAHDEEAVISRTLSIMLKEADRGEFDVLVVCNGCTDRTAEVVGSLGHPDVRVLVTPEPSKPAALNAGDDAARTFPRIYADADIELTTSALRALAGALDGGALAAGAKLNLHTADASLPVRMYYSIWSRLGYSRSAVLGSGVYALSEKGRRRFGRFPTIIADDYFVYSHFRIRERANPAGAVATVNVPRSLRALARRRIRIDLGNRQVRALLGRGGDVPPPGPLGVVKSQPLLAPAAVLFAAVNSWAGRQARERLRAERFSDWEKDTTTRGLPVTSRMRRNRTLRALLRPSTWVLVGRRVAFVGWTDAEQRKRLRLGADVRLSPVLSLRNGERISIGAKSRIGERVSLWAGDHEGRIDIGDGALFGPGVFVTASDYDFDASMGPVGDLPKREAHVRIGPNVWIGANVVVVAGVTIGEGCIIAAGSVVATSIPPFSVAAGVPARVIRNRGRNRVEHRD